MIRYDTPFLTAPARAQYFTGVRPGVSGVQPWSPGSTGLTMKSVGVDPRQPEKQNSKRMTNSKGLRKLDYIPLECGINRVGVTLFS